MAQFTINGWTIYYNYELTGTYNTQSTIRVKVKLLSEDTGFCIIGNSSSVKVANTTKSISYGKYRKEAVIFDDFFVVEHGDYVSKTTRIDIHIYVNGVYGAHYYEFTLPAPPRPVTPDKCGAPTEISVNKNYITPTGSFTVSWSGASAGPSNSITGYSIYWRVTKEGSAPNTSTYTGMKDITSTSTSGSYTISFTNNPQERTYKIVCGIITKGSAGSTYYSDLEIGGLVIINTKPGRPVIKIGGSAIADKTIYYVSNTSATVQVTATVTDINSDQTVSVRYSTNPNDSNPSIITTKSLGVGTYYFWGWDGLEWGPAFILTITIEPKITNVTGSTTFQKAYGWSAVEWGSAYKCRGVSEKTIISVNCNKSGTIKIYLQLKKTANYENGFVEDEITKEVLYNTQDYAATSTATQEINVCQTITNQYGNITDNNYYRWRLKIEFNDGNENDIAYFPNDDCFYILVGACAFGNSDNTGPNSNYIYNQFANNDIPNTAGKIANKFRLRIQKDDNINIYTIEVKINNTVYPVTFEKKSNGTYYVFDVTLVSSSPSGGNMIIRVIQTNSAKTITKISSCTKTTRLILAQRQTGAGTESSTNRITTIYPFNTTRTQTYEVWIKNPFNSAYEENISKAATAYNIKIEDIVIKAECNGETEIISPEGDNSDEGKAIIFKDNWLTLRLNTLKVFDFSQRTYKILNKIGTYNIDLSIQITNVFEESISSIPVTVLLDFNKEPIINFNKIFISTNKETWFEYKINSTSQQIDDSNKIQEGLYYKIKYNYTAYSSPDTWLCNLIMSQEAGKWSNNLGTVSVNISNNNGREGTTSSFEIITGRIPEISKAMTISDEENQVILRTAVATQFSSKNIDNNFTALIHTTPTGLVLKELEKTELQTDDSGLKYKFEINSPGFDGSSVSSATNSDRFFGAYIIDRNNNWYTDWFDTIPSFIIPTTVIEGNIAYSDNHVPTASTDLGVEILTKRTQYINGEIHSLSKKFRTNFIYVDIVAPTVAYRKNAIGINTTTIAEGQLLEIHAVQGKTQIKLQNTDNSYFLIDLSKGTIDYIS